MATFLGAFNLFFAVALIVRAWGDSQGLAWLVVLSQKGGWRCGQAAQKTRGGDKQHVRIEISIASQDHLHLRINPFSTNPSLLFFPIILAKFY
jgi:hypothetical protein